MNKMITFKSVTNNQELTLIEEMAQVIWHEHYTPIIGEEQVVYMLKKNQNLILSHFLHQFHYLLHVYAN